MGNNILFGYVLALLCLAVYLEFTKRSFADFLTQYAEYVLLSFFVTAGFAIRSHLYYFISGDMAGALIPWYNKLVDHGGFEGVRHFAKISDYAPTYLYFLAFLAEFKLDPLTGIKTLSVIFDLLLSIASYLILKRLLGTSSRLPALGFGLVFLSPTVLINSALWGQCDVIHTTFVLLAVLCILKEKKAFAALCWGLAFAFKIQSVFVFVPFLVLFLTQKIKTVHFLLLPLPYIILGFPAYFLEADISDIAQVYTKQADNYPHFTLNAPSVFFLIPEMAWEEHLKSAAIGMTIFAGLSVALFITMSKRELNANRLLLLFFLSSLLIPFLLPKMHERYFYLADVSGILFAFAYRQYWYLPVLVIFASLTSYYPFLLGAQLIEMKYAAMLFLFVIAKLALLCYKEFYGKNEEAMA